MHVTIRRYEGVVDASEELTLAMRQIASELSRVPGFVSFVLLRSESGVRATVCFFEDEPGLTQADGLLSAALARHLDVSPDRRPEVTTSEIIFQRGL